MGVVCSVYGWFVCISGLEVGLGTARGVIKHAGPAVYPPACIDDRTSALVASVRLVVCAH